MSVKCNDLWIGFDAAHYYDKVCAKTATEYFDLNEWEQKGLRMMDVALESVPDIHNFAPSHRSFEFMEQECHSIIDQLINQAA